ncbi:short-chain dehydrogenase/reductase SDR [Candidatus Vecturithrix granuli]|uniref:Short-chain dehydrogenase/reductase SDR n=1 Tax=Vecturithrix granuli TaxID=1499967 RepID=A0A081C4H7_VECG1|nr:short-chain dehydrogenase/reductase SDR [Candidatus Vecturithrix granuli]
MKITGNTVLITGGASGIGLSLAKVFLEHLNTVIVCGRNTNKLDQVEQQYPGIHPIQCDVSSPLDVTHLYDHVASHFPSLNILVNNAGIQHQYDFLNDERALQKIDEEIGINFTAVARLTRIVLPNLVKAPEAAIVNVSSFLGIVPKRSAPIYCATKAALHAFSQSLRYQLQGTPVRVFEIITPLVDTEMTRGREDDAGKMSPEMLAREVIRNIKKDQYEIRPGRTKLVLFLNRVVPSLIQKVVGKK